jgi:hypothetical protein
VRNAGLEAGAQVDSPARYEYPGAYREEDAVRIRTALEIALEGEHIELILLLLEHGAVVSRQTVAAAAKAGLCETLEDGVRLTKRGRETSARWRKRLQ